MKKVQQTKGRTSTLLVFGLDNLVQTGLVLGAALGLLRLHLLAQAVEEGVDGLDNALVVLLINNGFREGTSSTGLTVQAHQVSLESGGDLAHSLLGIVARLPLLIAAGRLGGLLLLRLGLRAGRRQVLGLGESAVALVHLVVSLLLLLLLGVMVFVFVDLFVLILLPPKCQIN